MTRKQIHQGMKDMEVYQTIRDIEIAVGIPHTLLNKALYIGKNGKPLPKKWHRPLKQYFLDRKSK